MVAIKKNHRNQTTEHPLTCIKSCAHTHFIVTSYAERILSIRMILYRCIIISWAMNDSKLISTPTSKHSNSNWLNQTSLFDRQLRQMKKWRNCTMTIFPRIFSLNLIKFTIEIGWEVIAWYSANVHLRCADWRELRGLFSSWILKHYTFQHQVQVWWQASVAINMDHGISCIDVISLGKSHSNVIRNCLHIIKFKIVNIFYVTYDFNTSSVLESHISLLQHSYFDEGLRLLASPSTAYGNLLWWCNWRT